MSEANGHAAAVAAVMQNPETQEDRLCAAISEFRKWMYMPDAAPLVITLGAIAANMGEGDPVWPLLVGAPSSGKTEILDALLGLPHMHSVGTLTEAALLSGVAKKERSADASGGLLRVIGQFGYLICKDFTSVLSMKFDTRNGVLAALREIYDGHWTRGIGVDGGRLLHWSGKLAVIGGVTPVIDQHQAAMANMGERFLFIRMPEADEQKQAKCALSRLRDENRMRKALRSAVNRVFEHVKTQPVDLTEDAEDRLCALATLAARCRSAVMRDGYNREIELVPANEMPARLVLCLARLMGGIRQIGACPEECWRLVEGVALDCIPAVRRSILQIFRHDARPVVTGGIADAIGLPTTTARRALEDLAGHGMMQRTSGGKEHIWQLSPLAIRLSEAAGLMAPQAARPYESSEVH